MVSTLLSFFDSTSTFQPFRCAKRLYIRNARPADGPSFGTTGRYRTHSKALAEISNLSVTE